MSKCFVKKIVNVAVVCFSIISFTTISTMTANAVTYTRSTDNDPVASGYSFDAYNMTYYNGMTGSYNGDMRLSPSIYSGDAYYTWIYPTISFAQSSCTVTLDVYLNHADFTDTGASYYFEAQPIEDLSGAGRTIGTINQKYAPAGWSSISRTVTRITGETYIRSRLVSVDASSGAYKHLGADGLKVTVTY